MDQNTEKRIENPYIPMAFEVPTKGETYPETSGWSLFPGHGVRYFWFGTKIGETLVLNDCGLKSVFFWGVSWLFFVGNLLFMAGKGCNPWCSKKNANASQSWTSIDTEHEKT